MGKAEREQIQGVSASGIARDHHGSFLDCTIHRYNKRFFVFSLRPA
jgi:hypothetical protein